MSFFSKFVAGTAGAGADIADNLITEKLEAKRQERLSQIRLAEKAEDRKNEAEFLDSRYDIDSKRRLDEYRDKKGIDKEFAPPLRDEYKSIVIGQEIVDGVPQDIMGTLNIRTNERYDQYGRLITPPTPREEARAAFIKNNLKKTGKSAEELGRVFDERVKQANQASPPAADAPTAAPGAGQGVSDKVIAKKDIRDFAPPPDSGSDAVAKIRRGTIDSWIENGFDVKGWLADAIRAGATMQERQAIEKYLSKMD